MNVVASHGPHDEEQKSVRLKTNQRGGGGCRVAQPSSSSSSSSSKINGLRRGWGEGTHVCPVRISHSGHQMWACKLFQATLAL